MCDGAMIWCCIWQTERGYCLCGGRAAGAEGDSRRIGTRGGVVLGAAVAETVAEGVADAGRGGFAEAVTEDGGGGAAGAAATGTVTRPNHTHHAAATSAISAPPPTKTATGALCGAAL